MSTDRLKLAVHMQGTAAHIKGADTHTSSMGGLMSLIRQIPYTIMLKGKQTL